MRESEAIKALGSILIKIQLFVKDYKKILNSTWTESYQISCCIRSLFSVVIIHFSLSVWTKVYKYIKSSVVAKWTAEMNLEPSVLCIITIYNKIMNNGRLSTRTIKDS